MTLIGCGGNGSSMLLNLARLHWALSELGHPGLRVTAYDGDMVSESNLGRQCFFAPDVGRNKADVLIHRINLAYGLNWRAELRHFGQQHDFFQNELVVVAVDSAGARRAFHEGFKAAHKYPIILDLGNGSNFGQVLLGGFSGLPSPYDQLPSLTDSQSEDRQLPSCSMAEALRAQELFVNSMGVTLASHLLWELFRKGRTNKAGFYFNLDPGKTVPVAVRSVLEGMG